MLATIAALHFFVFSKPAWANNTALFIDQTHSLGVAFEHQDGRSGKKYFIETAASGGGWMDIDNDGDLDLYLINGAPTPGSANNIAPKNSLYEQRDGRFLDITEKAGVGDQSYGMGLCAGDVDGDGLLDFLVTNYGPDRLYRNLGGNRFEQTAERAGVNDSRWGTSCAFGDVDADGDLDLYVAHYVDFRFNENPYCGDRARDLRAYCQPSAFSGVVDSLYINNGQGVFQDEASLRGIVSSKSERGFGVIMSDVDVDGDLDIYVANDGTTNRLYINDGKGQFEESSMLSGAGLNRHGLAEAGMGVDLGDVDADGLFDILVTNYSMENNTLYRNMGDSLFDDVTTKFGLGSISFRNVGWGIQFLDFDNDGDLDYSVVNGHPVDNISEFEPGLKYRQANQLFRNEDGKSFKEIGANAGDVWLQERVSRGLAAGDWNNDGRIDLLVTNTNDSAQILTNRTSTTDHWLGIRLHGTKSNKFAIGARVLVKHKSKVQVREVRSGGGFLGQSDFRLHFGLGNWRGPTPIEIHWPSGRVDSLLIKAVDQYIDIHESQPLSSLN